MKRRVHQVEEQVWIGSCQPWWRRLAFSWLRVKPIRFD